jgi:2-oxoglutarate ferredoxin oxidoreductase subunit alpha
MKEDLNIRVTGEAGQGMKTIGSVLGKVFKEAGFYVFSNLDYMSRIRGGNNFYQLRIATAPKSCPKEKIDLLIPLTKEALHLHKDSLDKDGLAVVDKEEFKLDECKSYICIDYFKLARKAGGSDLYINSVCSGILAAMSGIDLEIVKKVLYEMFTRKSKEIVEKNVKAAELGYNQTSENNSSSQLKLAKPSGSPKYILDGKQAVALGAISAGCKFYSAYPMSPSTGVMDTIARYMDKFGIIVEQAEDEIAAVNMAIGASVTGVRAMTSTSGGGFALMGEGISLAGMTETPLVVGNFQRPGPATGFPTRTEQADLNLVLGAGHGEFAKIIFAPGTIEESFYLTKKAFNMAEKYQIPAIILSDQFLADSARNINKLDFDSEAIERNILSVKEAKAINKYKRYELTTSGISPRAIFSRIDDVIYIDSDEHTEEGHITEDADVRIKMVEKRFQKKMDALLDEFIDPTVYNLVRAETVLFCFGSVLGPLRECLEEINDPNLAMVHLSQVWPINSQKIKALVKNKKRVFSVENNAEGQLAKLLHRETGIRVNGSILKYDGRPFTLESLIKQLKDVVSS